MTSRFASLSEQDIEKIIEFKISQGSGEAKFSLGGTKKNPLSRVSTGSFAEGCSYTKS